MLRAGIATRLCPPGRFILNGAQVNGQSIVPEGLVAEATTRAPDIGRPGAAMVTSGGP